MRFWNGEDGSVQMRGSFDAEMGARDGACIGCGGPPAECEVHHITPCQQGGKTRLDNLVLVCWACHDLIHDHNWYVTTRDGRYRLEPPDPAHPTQPAPQRKPTRRTPQHEPKNQAPQPEADRCSPQPELEQRTPQRRRTQKPAITTKPPPNPLAATPLWEDPAA